MDVVDHSLPFNTSNRGFQALCEGKKPFDLWTQQDIKYEVIRIKLRNKPCPVIHFDSLDDIPLHILAEKLLVSHEWHHCRFLPCWFYEINESVVISLTMSDVRKMLELAEQENARKNKPKWAAFNIYRWGISQSSHEFCEVYKVYGVVYQNTAYFADGKCMRIIKDKCEVAKIYEKVPSGRREMFNRIRKKMRAYEIYC